MSTHTGLKAGADSINYDNPPVGCYVDASSQSADTLNERTVSFATDYGFDAGNPFGSFDGLRGREIEMCIEDARACSHAGRCDEDVAQLVRDPLIAAQLDKFTPEDLRASLKEWGAWSDDDLQDHEQNRQRAVWLAACDISENLSQWLSETADKAVDFLNSLEHRAFLSWMFEDNSLFLSPDIESAKEDVGFISSKQQDYPPDDYEGEWLHVSDHGNCTLYVRTAGQDKEIWSVA